MNWLPDILHQAFFGGLAAAGFGVLFNCPLRLVALSFVFGAVALATRTLAMDWGIGIAFATFLAALMLAILDRFQLRPYSIRGSILPVVGCIPMIPGSLAAKGLRDFIMLLQPNQQQEIMLVADAAENFIVVFATLLAMGTALVIPRLLFPPRVPPSHNGLTPP